MTWKFLQDNWATVKEKFQAAFLLARIIDVRTWVECCSYFVY